MNVVIFGASGMVGGGVLKECLEDPEVESVLVAGRTRCGVTHTKLRELIHENLFDLASVADELRGCDACLYCIGVSSTGLSEAEYRRITLDLTVAVAKVLVESSPDIKFCFVSGQGTDGTGHRGTMWARVKGEAENYVLSLPNESYMFRPGVIQPMKGVRSKTALYQAFYTVLTPLFPLLRRLFPGAVTTTVTLGRAMIRAARDGYPRRILETRDINEAGA